MMRFVPASELEERENEQTRIELAAQEEEGRLSSSTIVSYVRNCWEEAKKAKENYVEDQILSNLRQFEGQYPPDKLAAIKQIGGSEVFMMITNAKVKNAANWALDIVFQPGSRPWGIEPTPVPEMPGDYREEMMKEAVQPLMDEYLSQSIMSGQPPDMSGIPAFVESRMPDIEKSVRDHIYNVAKEKGREAEKSVDDKLVEGGWYDSMYDVIYNVVMHTGILKGPIIRKRKTVKPEIDKFSGKIKPVITEELYPCYESRHPLYIYPAPDSTGVNDGYLIDRVQLSPSSLQELALPVC